MATTVHFSLESGSGVLAVWCSECHESKSFAYSWEHEAIAYWTKGKERILCPACAEKQPELIYRRVFSRGDLPAHRSQWKWNNASDAFMWGKNPTNLIKERSYLFCSKEDEEAELVGKIEKYQTCKCGKCEGKRYNR